MEEGQNGKEQPKLLQGKQEEHEGFQGRQEGDAGKEVTALTLSDVEAEIYEVYQWFAREAPGVTPQEDGHLGQLWSLFDSLVAQEN